MHGAVFTQECPVHHTLIFNVITCSSSSWSTETSVSWTSLNGKIGWKNGFEGNHQREELRNESPNVVRGIWESDRKSELDCGHWYYTRDFGFYFEQLPPQIKWCLEMLTLTVESRWYYWGNNGSSKNEERVCMVSHIHNIRTQETGGGSSPQVWGLSGLQRESLRSARSTKILSQKQKQNN